METLSTSFHKGNATYGHKKEKTESNNNKYSPWAGYNK